MSQSKLLTWKFPRKHVPMTLKKFLIYIIISILIHLHYFFWVVFSDVSVVTPIPDPPFDKLRGKLPYFLIFPNFGKSSDMDAAIFEKSNLPENANPRRVVHKQLLSIVVVVVDFVCLFVLLSLFCLLLLLIF